MNVLIIDDEMMSLGILNDSVKQSLPDADIFPFSSPLDAIEFLKEKSCSIAFLDIYMRDMNGIEAARELRKINPDIKILFVTGDASCREQAHELNASAYLMKPVSKDMILSELNKIL